MMKRKKQLENSIIHITCMLNKLRIHVDDNEEYSMTYNRLLIQRAELRKNLEERKTTNIVEIFNSNLKKLKNLGAKNREKLISDYFS